MTTYSQMTAAVVSTIKSTLTTDDKWLSVGQSVRDFFGTETALTEVKAQFLADAIIPALKPVHQKALALELCRKGSAEFNAFDAGQKDTWETANQAKKDARAIAHTMFTRVVRYAFPTEKK